MVKFYIFYDHDYDVTGIMTGKFPTVAIIFRAFIRLPTGLMFPGEDDW